MTEYEKYIEEFQKKWLDENSQIATLMSTGMIPYRPDLGYFLKVDVLDIPKEIFPEEFEKIVEAYHSVCKKLQEHYKNEKNNRNM